MLPKSKTELFRVRHPEAARNGKVKVDALFDYMQELAADHAEELGMGCRALEQVHQMWVLSRLKLKLSRLPEYGESVEMTTWPSGIEKLFATREFLMKCGGKLVGVATSDWLLLDSQKMRPLRLNSLVAEMPDNSDKPCYFPGLAKIMPRPVGSSVEQRIHESMIDINQHLNNARYTAMACDWLADVLGKPPELSEIQVSYVAATVKGELLTTSGSLVGNEFYIEISGEDGLHFQAAGSLATLG